MFDKSKLLPLVDFMLVDFGAAELVVAHIALASISHVGSKGLRVWHVRKQTCKDEKNTQSHSKNHPHASV